jgi:uncharacterized protein YybS (DUF2232 family)
MGGLAIQRDMKITDLMGCTVSVILLLLASASMPYIGPFFSLLIPLPFVFYASKLGLNKGAQACAVSLVIIGLIAWLAGHSYVIMVCLEFGILGFVISEIFRRELSFGFTIFWGTVFMLVTLTVFLFMAGLSNGVDPVDMILDYFKVNLGDTARIYEEMELAPEHMAQMEEFLRVMSEFVKKAFPALIVVGTGLIVWINVVVSKPIFKVGRIKYPEFGRLDHWYSPEVMVWVVIISGFSLFLPISIIKLAALNILLVMAFIYMFHGLAIVQFIFRRFRIPGWARAVIYIMMLAQQLFLFVLAMAGFFDQWVDFRKIHKKRVDASEN